MVRLQRGTRAHPRLVSPLCPSFCTHAHVPTKKWVHSNTFQPVPTQEARCAWSHAEGSLCASSNRIAAVRLQPHLAFVYLPCRAWYCSRTVHEARVVTAPWLGPLCTGLRKPSLHHLPYCPTAAVATRGGAPGKPPHHLAGTRYRPLYHVAPQPTLHRKPSLHHLHYCCRGHEGSLPWWLRAHATDPFTRLHPCCTWLPWLRAVAAGTRYRATPPSTWLPFCWHGMPSNDCHKSQEHVAPGSPQQLCVR